MAGVTQLRFQSFTSVCLGTILLAGRAANVIISYPVSHILPPALSGTSTSVQVPF